MRQIGKGACISQGNGDTCTDWGPLSSCSGYQCAPLWEGQGFLSAESRLDILLLVTQKEEPLVAVAEVGGRGYPLRSILVITHHSLP